MDITHCTPESIGNFDNYDNGIILIMFLKYPHVLQMLIELFMCKIA